MCDTITARLDVSAIVLANALSQIHPWSTVLDEALADCEDQFRSWVMQNVHLAKAFIPAMVARGGGATSA